MPTPRTRMQLLLRFARGRGAWFAVIAATGLVLAVPDVIAAGLLRRVVNDGLVYEVGRWLPLLGLMVGLFAIKGALLYANTRAAMSLSYDVTAAVQKALFARLLRLEVSAYHREDPGDLMARISISAGNVQHVLLALVRLLLGEGLLALVYLGAILWLSPLVFAGVVALAVPYAVMLSLQQRAIRRRAAVVVERRAAWMARLEEILRLFERVRGLGAEQIEADGFADETDGASELEKQLDLRKALVTPFLELLLGLGLLLVAGLAIGELVAGRLELGDIAALTGLALLFVRPTNRIVVAVGTLRHRMAHLDRVLELLQLMGADEGAADEQPWRSCETGRLALEASGVRLAHGDGDPVLDGVSFSLTGPGLLVITGPSGAGKTTLARVLAGLDTPAEGAVRVAVSRADAEEPLLYLPQQLELFNRSLAGNVAYPGERPDGGRLDRLVGALGLAGLFEEHERGAGSGGALVSEGERRRIGLANALYLEREVLLLDEPLVGVNEALASRVVELLAAEADSRLIVVVSHSEKLLEAAGEVLFLSQGRIAARGEHRLLLEEDDAYRENFLLARSDGAAAR